MTDFKIKFVTKILTRQILIEKKISPRYWQDLSHFTNWLISTILCRLANGLSIIFQIISRQNPWDRYIYFRFFLTNLEPWWILWWHYLEWKQLLEQLLFCMLFDWTNYIFLPRDKWDSVYCTVCIIVND